MPSSPMRAITAEAFSRLSLIHIYKSQRYFIDTFIDKEHCGVYWLVNPDGEVLNASKYTYAMTYAIYGLAEHYLATGNSESLDMACLLYTSRCVYATASIRCVMIWQCPR